MKLNITPCHSTSAFNIEDERDNQSVLDQHLQLQREYQVRTVDLP
jgi:hypothetical protein